MAKLDDNQPTGTGEAATAQSLLNHKFTLKQSFWIVAIGAAIGLSLLAKIIDPNDTLQPKRPPPLTAEQVQEQRDEAERVRQGEAHGASQDPCPWISDPREHMNCFIATMPRR